MQRRQFLRHGAAIATAVLASKPSRLFASPNAARPALFTVMGVAGEVTRAADLQTAGAGYLVESVSRFLVPDQPEAAFEERLALAAAAPIPVRACNIFLGPRHLRCVGPDADHGQVLAWADTTFRRARRAGVEFIVFGSGRSRQVPEGWAVERADEQFIALLRAMGPVAAAHGMIVAVESLQARECNYLVRLPEVVHVVRSAAHPSIRLLADFYHMAAMEEDPSVLLTAAPWLHGIEIAERDGRTAPGVNGQDFTPWFDVLRRAGWSGPITIEGNWDPTTLAGGFREIARQSS
ncbi:hypothetical protein ASA1KI_29760 [Opitutales bacterium ASA1]|uniref:sugar phosphate isomerase/epimerase family protein n=1 Tax=Congregicoccus parvus TaxID=3081749 RepID=UPI002B28E2A2|nr:hypothetical protein ASA1KI_29760 [Opitutales bacterium ASA1]